MAEKKFKGAPFGTQAARFDVAGVHPANKRTGTYTEIPYCKKRTSDLERNLGPGTYNVESGDFSSRAVQVRARGPGWRRALETARLAQMTHLRNCYLPRERTKTKIGPDTYNITSFIEELEKRPRSVRGICETREERFRDVQSWTPGPGTYGIGGVPSAALEEKARQSVSTRPSMESRALLERFPTECVDSGLSPGTYNLKTSTDIILSSGAGKRGPYDCFSSSRDKASPCGHYAAPGRVSLDPGQYTKEVPRFGEELCRPEKRMHGVFSALDQYPATPTERIYLSTLSQCPRPATFPGPGWYDAGGVSSEENHRAPPFLSSAPRFTKRLDRIHNRNYNMVGPGQYNIATVDQRNAANNQSSCFSSRTQRYLHCSKRDKYTQERLRSMNVPVSRRAFLLQPDGAVAGRMLCSSA
ncbi:lymphocyte expansion molecule-like [Chanos chanos]|uniref:Lymphocyte expansion molecule-like n=1 Tax=Chanos chanos TaxID=29144 RepID=A0A6J2V2Y2_CHACN|nr:lymphocyte expansion molecule [Chanos chanos]